MRLATFKHQTKTAAGVVIDGRVVPLGELGRFPGTLEALIAAGRSMWQLLSEALSSANVQGLELEAVELLAPVQRPPKNIICLGWNYKDHVTESAQASGRAMELPEFPVVFTKAPTTLNSPYGEIPYDSSLSAEIDWEVELGVIIGVGGRSIPRERALEHVFGYTVINDVSARDIQFRHKQFFVGKSLDGACPIGPWIVTADEIRDPQALRLTTHVNGELKQEGNTSAQIFSVAETIGILSRGMTLEPGDIIATGTPDGVGFARTPPEFLKPGDLVECEIEGIGLLRNRVTGK